MLARVRNYFSPKIQELEPRVAYRLWARNYPPYAHNLLMELEQRAVLNLLPDVRNQRVLDLACGSGRYAQILRERGARVTGLDFSFEMLTRAEQNFSRVQGDLNALPFADACADCIVCGLAVGHVGALVDALREMARVLTPRGILLYSDFNATGSARDWKRTFRVDAQTYAVQHIPRTEDEHRSAIQSADLIMETIESVSVTDEAAHSNPQAAQFRAHWADTPIALVVRAHKP